MKTTLSLFSILLALAVLLVSAFVHNQAIAQTLSKGSNTATPAAEVQNTTSPTGDSTAGDAEPDEFAEFEEEFEVSIVHVNDPLEPVNRALFTFNDRMYFWFLKPLAQGYNFVLPTFFRKGVRNFFSNLLTPIRFTNCILQGKATPAGTEAVRFFTNTTIGVLGVWDPALDLFDLTISDEDLGQTFGAYGIGNGFYIVWPVFGSSTLRDSVGWLGDTYVNPITYLDTWQAVLGVGLYRRFNDLTFRIGDLEAVKQASIDPYIAVRDGYIQFRNSLVDQ
jgi:phospholipid-binding lipoprotein MlaA